MKVSELIEILQSEPPDRLVLVDGYEGGFDQITTIRDTFARNNREPAHEGEFFEVHHSEPDAFRCLVISRFRSWVWTKGDVLYELPAQIVARANGPYAGED